MLLRIQIAQFVEQFTSSMEFGNGGYKLLSGGMQQAQPMLHRCQSQDGIIMHCQLLTERLKDRQRFFGRMA